MAIKKILIVDDSPTERHHLVTLLNGQGYELETAENGEEAIALAKETKPDLILMDVVMPGLNGFQTTRALSRETATQEIPVIICTSKDQESDRAWGMRQGASDYLVKPVEKAALQSAIQRLENKIAGPSTTTL